MKRMKPDSCSRAGIFRLGEIVFRPGRMRVALLPLVLAAVLSSAAATETNILQIQAIGVSGKSLSFEGKESVNLGSVPENIVFGFGQGTNSGKMPLRLSCTLEGYETAWHEGGAEMALTVRFYNNAGDQISQNIYSMNGESTGWTGSLKSSSLTHRRERVAVPPEASIEFEPPLAYERSPLEFRIRFNDPAIDAASNVKHRCSGSNTMWPAPR